MAHPIMEAALPLLHELDRLIERLEADLAFFRRMRQSTAGMTDGTHPPKEGEFHGRQDADPHRPTLANSRYNRPLAGGLRRVVYGNEA